MTTHGSVTILTFYIAVFLYLIFVETTYLLQQRHRHIREAFLDICVVDNTVDLAIAW